MKYVAAACESCRNRVYLLLFEIFKKYREVHRFDLHQAQLVSFFVVLSMKLRVSLKESLHMCFMPLIMMVRLLLIRIMYYVRSTCCSNTYAPLKASRKRKCACCDNCYNYCHSVARFLNSRRDDKERESKKKASESENLAARLANFVTKNKNLRGKVQYKNRQIAVLREKLAGWREKEEKNGGMTSLNEDECETWSIFFRYACDLIDKEFYSDDQMELRLLKKELFEAEFKHMGQFNKNHDKRGIKRSKISARVLNYAVQLSTKVGKTAYEEKCLKRPGLASWSAKKISP